MQSEIRKKLLDAFTNAGDTHISGQRLAVLLGCSRTAVWKHIEELRKEGFILEAVRNKGYKILQTPKKITADELRLGLRTNFVGQYIHYEESVESTQKIAHKLAYQAAKEGTVIIAEEQIKGRGRMDRKWHSPKSTGIWMSIILRPKILPSNAPQLTLLAAVAVVQAIEKISGLQPKIKWPNDILLGGKKVTGILTELQAEADRINSIIIGIGINVNQEVKDFPEELRKTASSLLIESGNFVQRAELAKAVFSELEKLYLLYLEKGFLPIKLLWESYAISIGNKIVARTLTQVIEGTALGITDEGVLKIEDNENQIHLVYSADIELSEESK